MPKSLLGVALLAMAVLAVSIAGSAIAAAPPSGAAATACELIGENSVSGSIEACAQGYEGAKAGKTEEASCDKVGSGAVAKLENVKDCQAGWSTADPAGKGATSTPSAAAATACEVIGENSVSGSIEACAQGYDGAKAGKSEEAVCDSIGYGAVVGPENIKDCQEGWSTADVAGKTSASEPSSAAVTACEVIGENSVSGSIEACAQGYEGAKTGKTEQSVCDSIGYGAVVGPENIKDCQEGFSEA